MGKNNRSFNILFILALDLCSHSVFAQSILKYSLSEWVNRPTPAIQIKMDALQPFDVTDNPSQGWPAKNNALQVSAGGGDVAKMAAFRLAITSDANPNQLNYFGCPVETNPLIEVYTKQKPYMIRQGDYQGWINIYGSQQNLVATKSFASNTYRSNLVCPLNVDPINLPKTLGHSVRQVGSTTTSDAVEMSIDNSINPWRWIAPINVVHAAEQPSMVMVIQAKNKVEAQDAGQYLMDYANGIAKPKRIYLDYTIDLEIDDQRNVMGEFSVDDYLKNSNGLDLISKMKAITFGGGIPYPDVNKKYYQTRLFEPSFQLSLMVNLREEGGWLDQEFMLAALNYKKDLSGGALLSPNLAMNNYIYEGGNNSNGVSWYRLAVNALTDVPGIIPQAKSQIYKGGNGFWAIPAHQKSINTMWGSIDLTEFVRIAKANQFLTGHNPVPAKPSEKLWDKLSLNWAAVIFENHGPFKSRVKVRTFNISYR